MDIHLASIMYEIFFIMILIFVCMVFTLINLKIGGVFTQKRWVLTSAFFFGICFATISLWYVTIGFTF